LLFFQSGWQFGRERVEGARIDLLLEMGHYLLEI